MQTHFYVVKKKNDYGTSHDYRSRGENNTGASLEYTNTNLYDTGEQSELWLSIVQYSRKNKLGLHRNKPGLILEMQVEV